MIIVNGLQPLTIITKGSILDVAAALDPPLHMSPLFQLKPALWKNCWYSFAVGLLFVYQRIYIFLPLLSLPTVLKLLKQ